jgi:hypothetical protein
LLFVAVVWVPAARAGGGGQASADFVIGVPSGEFKDQLDKNGYGGSARALWRPEDQPILLGIEGGFLILGHESRREPFSTTIPDVTVEVVTDNNLVQGDFLLRLQPPRGTVRPYLDGLIGFNYLFTKTTIKNASNDEEVASSTNFDDTTINYGGGGGLMFVVYKGKPPANPDDASLKDVMIDLGVRYVAGGQARYLKKGSISRQEGQVRYRVSESKTDLLAIRVGVAVEF